MNKILPVELVQRSLALVERTHQTLSPRDLPRMIASKRNAVAVAMLPEASVILGAATSSFKMRVCLWASAALILGLAPFLTWWLVVLAAVAVVVERVVAKKERRFWILLAAILLSAETLASDFAGWGTAHPDARRAAVHALGSTAAGDAAVEWLDYYLPRREQIGAELMRAFGPPG